MINYDTNDYRLTFFYNIIVKCTFHAVVLQCTQELSPEELNFGNVPDQVFHLSSLPIFCSGRKPIGQRAVRRLIALHPKQNV